jgi:hypothetical protein
VRGVVATLALILLGGVAGAAWGSSGAVDRSCQKSGCTDHTRYKADPGERNDVRVTAEGRVTTFHDLGATVRGGPGCSVVDEHTVRCQETEFGRTYGPVVEAGDGDDRVEDAGAVGADLYGGRGDDLLLGSSQFQYLYGEGGIDRLVGRGGGDVFVDYDVMPWADYDRPDSDTMVGTDDSWDAVDYQARRRGIRVDLAEGVAGERGERDRLTSIEYILGGSGDDVLAGDDGPNRISTSAGDDRMYGRGGDDTITTSVGTQRVDAGSGDDTIEAGHHTDLPGEDDSDRIACGRGADRVFFVAPHDLIGADCESVDLVEIGDGGLSFGAVTLRLPFAAVRDPFVVVPRRVCSPSQALVAEVRTSDRGAPAKGLLGRAAARCSERSRSFRELRLALSARGAAYLRLVRAKRVRIEIVQRRGDAVERAGFVTTLRWAKG